MRPKKTRAVARKEINWLISELQKKGFVDILTDSSDKRKQRVVITQRCIEFCNMNDDMSTAISGIETLTEILLNVGFEIVKIGNGFGEELKENSDRILFVLKK